MRSRYPLSKKTQARDSTLIEIDVAVLELALPSQAPQQVGILVLDVKKDQLFCRVHKIPNIDEDASEVLAYLADDLEAQARERGGKVVLGYLQNTLSNVLRISNSKRSFVADPTDAINTLADMPYDREETNAAETAPCALRPSTTGGQTLLVTPSQVLLIEDNPADVFLIQESFRMCHIDAHFTVATDGEAAIGLLDSIGREVPMPDLILLDINLPKRNGFEVLKSFRASSQLANTPISMLTSSFRGGDFEKALRSGANCYALKANDLEGLSKTIEALSTFCMNPSAQSGVGSMPQIGGICH